MSNHTTKSAAIKNKAWKRSGEFNKHHLTPRSQGGQSVTSNLLRLDTKRHDAWHAIFCNLRLNEIITLLLYVKQVMESSIFNGIQLKSTVMLLVKSNSVYHSNKEIKAFKEDMRILNAWTFLFRDKSINEIIEIFLRLKKIKNNVVMLNYLTSDEILKILSTKNNSFSLKRQEKLSA
jgi:hypothetical protein